MLTKKAAKKTNGLRPSKKLEAQKSLDISITKVMDGSSPK
jgi:hypothetical protein